MRGNFYFPYAKFLVFHKLLLLKKFKPKINEINARDLNSPLLYIEEL